MSNLREEFEKLPEIQEYLTSGYYEFISDECGYYSDVEGVSTEAIDLAWYAFQEQQKKIDAARKEINNFFDNQTMISTAREYANKLADVLELLK